MSNSVGVLIGVVWMVFVLDIGVEGGGIGFAVGRGGAWHRFNANPIKRVPASPWEDLEWLRDEDAEKRSLLTENEDWVRELSKELAEKRSLLTENEDWVRDLGRRLADKRSFLTENEDWVRDMGGKRLADKRSLVTENQDWLRYVAAKRPADSGEWLQKRGPDNVEWIRRKKGPDNVEWIKRGVPVL